MWKDLFFKKFTAISPYMVIAVLLFLWLDSCHSKRAIEHKYEHNLSLKDQVVKDVELKNGQLAKQVKAYRVTEEELKDQVWVKDDSIKDLLEKLKDPKVVVKIVTETKFDTIFIPFKETVDYSFTRDFKSDNPFYEFSGTVTEKGVRLNPPKIFNTQRMVMDYSGKVPRVTITNSNPYLHTTQIEGQVVEDRKKRWVIGVGGSWNMIQPPYFGIFGGYKLIEF